MTVTAEIVNNLVIVPVSVNGSKPVPFILDTGASSSAIDRAGHSVTFDIGGVTLPPVDTAAVDLSGLEADLGQHVAGILGSEIFKQRVVEIDYVERVVRLHEPSGFYYAGSAPPLSILFQGDVPLVRPIFVTPDGDELDAKLEFSTGQAGALTLIRSFVIGADLTDASNISAGVTRLKAIRLGGASLGNVMATVTPTAAAAGIGGETMGVLGGEALRRFKVFVDYSRSQVFLEPNEHLSEPFEFDMSGMSLAAGGDTLHEYRVRSVIAGSPAAEQGVAGGDVLAAVNGKASDTMTLAEIRKLFREPNRQFALEVRRGAKLLQITLTMRRLF